MPEEEFDWYEDTADIDVGEYKPQEKRKTLIEKLYSWTQYFSTYATIISLLVLAFRYLLGFDGVKYRHVTLNMVLAMIVILFGTFPILSGLIKTITLFIRQFVGIVMKRQIEAVHRLLAFVAWLLVDFYILKALKPKILVIYGITKSFILSGLLTSSVFAVLGILLEKFYIYFLQASLAAKAAEVDIRERILAEMKSYRYEVSELSNSTATAPGCLDFIFGAEEDEFNEQNASHIELFRKTEEAELGTLFLKSPEVFNLYDANTLAKDVFMKASSNGETLNFDEFNAIFSYPQLAFQAFAFFDTADDNTISKKEFRETVLSFFVERLNLEKNMEIAENFVRIISNVLYGASFGFLCLAYLVIFGIALKDILAFAISSALVLNFVISGMALDLYFNVMFVLSHPFDVGDDIIVDGVDYKVHEIGLTNCSFLGSNGGKITFLNSDLWKKKIVNMTRAPEKRIVFEFALDPNIDLESYKMFVTRIRNFVKDHHFDYHERFSLESSSEVNVGINKLSCALVLRFRSYKTRNRKFYLRVEFSKFLSQTFKEAGLTPI